MSALGIIKVMVIFTYCTSMGTAIACTSDDDCLFGGVCDKVLQACTCNFACNRFAASRLVCSPIMRYPQSECFFLTKSCEMQENVPITTFVPEVFAKTGTCKKFEFVIKEEFCENQSYCSGNGMCMKKQETGSPFCRCASSFSGDRCETKAPVVRAVNEPSGWNDDTQGGIGPLPLAGIVMASLAVITLVVFVLGKRFYKPSTNNNSTDDRPGDIDGDNERGQHLCTNSHSELTVVSSIKAVEGPALKEVVVTNCATPIENSTTEDRSSSKGT